MCGIAGKIYFDPQHKVEEQLLRQMARVIAHRGPDDEGVFCDKNVGLANRRLAIIDLSPAGHQPMSNADQSIWITFNGEIYNFQFLRRELLQREHKFKSQSDTEVIINLYAEYGEKFLERLRGMFALAIWDAKNKKLILARDRVGEKPLKYYLSDKFLVFASELKAIFADPAVPREPDAEAIDLYFNLHYCPSPTTGFRGIRKLPAGHYLVCQNGRTEICRYWQPDFSRKLRLRPEEWQTSILDSLRESVRGQMIADVPIGAALSGGVDSSAVVALMSQESIKPIETFSVGFEGVNDELPYARKVAKKFKTNHHEIVVKFDFMETIEEIFAAYEEPFADTSALPTWHLAKAVKPQVKVILTGDGGDENFAGYNKYNLSRWFLRYRKIQPLLGKMMTPAIGHPWNSASEEEFLLKLISFFETINPFSLNFVAAKFAEARVSHPLEKISYFDFVSYLPDDLMVKTDIAMMAHSIESRSPLLDWKFLEFTAQIPFNLKLKGGENKYIFKRALRRLLPDEILNRKKQGFGLPLSRWFASAKVVNYVESVLNSPPRFAIERFKKDEVSLWLKQPTKNAYKLWALLALELWFRKYF